MRHRKSNRKLGRRSAPRKALLQHLVIGLFQASPTEDHAERIITTPQKAKEARRLAERLITLGKKGTLAARRRALAMLPNKAVIRKLFAEIAPRYADRPGGYTRILHLGPPRLGDAAPQVIFELVGLSEEVEKKPVKPKVVADTEKNEEKPPAAEPARDEPKDESPDPDENDGGEEADGPGPDDAGAQDKE